MYIIMIIPWCLLKRGKVLRDPMTAHPASISMHSAKVEVDENRNKNSK